MMIVVIAPFKVKKGARDAVTHVAKACVEATRKEPGCIMYELHASTEDEQSLVFVEKWKDKDALRQHMASAHLKKFSEDRAPYLDSRGDVQLLEATATSL
jgi:quinol monooxygenase YgiN